MMPANLLRLQVAAAIGNRRQVLLRIGVTALLALPFIFVAMPPRAQTAGLIMVILFTSFFGAAVGHAHLRDDGRLERLMLLPTDRGLLWLDLVLAFVMTRLAPAAVVLAAFLIVNGQSIGGGTVVTVMGLLCGSLLLLAVLGVATATLARSNAEVHLFGALAVGALAFISGITPLPNRLAWLASTASWSPIHGLYATLLETAENAGRAPGGRLVVAAVMLFAVAGTMVVRWHSGANRQIGFDEADTMIDNGMVSGG